MTADVKPQRYLRCGLAALDRVLCGDQKTARLLIAGLPEGAYEKLLSGLDDLATIIRRARR
ncbi:MAG TPA: hypothetical protein VIV12_06310 [Streptosporangiaceae bacterium]